MSDQEVATAEPIVKAQEAEETQTNASEVEAPAAEAEVTPADQSNPLSPDKTSSNDETSPQDEALSNDEASSDNSESTDESKVISILALDPGQKLAGTVKNITDFGAFVDIGLPQDGLVHISELARRKVDNVSEVVSVGQEIDVWVKKVDHKRGRISLTMIKPITLRLRDVVEEADLEGIVTRLESYGAFVDIGTVRDGLVHISQITHDYIKHPEEILAVGDTVKVKVLKVNRKKRQIDLSIKALLPLPEEEVIEAPIVEKVVKEVPAEKEDEASAVPTAMAMAYAAMQSRNQTDKSDTSSSLRDGGKRRKELDEIIARTLAASD